MKTSKLLIAVISFLGSSCAFAGTDVVLVWFGSGYEVVASGTNTYYMDRFYFNGGPWSGVKTYYNAAPIPEWYGIGTEGDLTFWWDVMNPDSEDPPTTPPVGSEDTPLQDP